MRTVTLKLPDNIELNEKEITIMLSAQLYNLGKMSLGQAANLVDLNKEEFINELGKYNVTVFGETLEELEQEFLIPRKLQPSASLKKVKDIKEFSSRLKSYSKGVHKQIFHI